MRQTSRAAWLICCSRCGSCSKAAIVSASQTPSELRFFHHHRRAVPRQRFGIDALVIVGRARERNEYCRLPCRRDFRDRACARAADHQIGARKGCRHVFDELEDLRRLAQRLICRQRVIIVTLAGLMNDVNARRLALQAPAGSGSWLH